MRISGYDRVSSVNTSALEDLGIQINYQDNVSKISNDFLDNKNSIVIYTPAIPSDHKQYQLF